MRRNENILIHCMEGRSRSITVTIFYLMICNGWRLQYALDFMKLHRPNVSLHTTYLKQLKATEEYLLDKIEKLREEETTIELEGITKVESLKNLSDQEEVDSTASATPKKTPTSLEYSTDDSFISVTKKRKIRGDQKMDIFLIFRQGLDSTDSDTDTEDAIFSSSTISSFDNFTEEERNENILDNLLEEIGSNIITPYIELLFSDKEHLPDSRPTEEKDVE